jgi:ElaB/YqjD/DUF883 family membrane-anchored ribosome-binding protein
MGQEVSELQIGNAKRNLDQAHEMLKEIVDRQEGLLDSEAFTAQDAQKELKMTFFPLVSVLAKVRHAQEHLDKVK